MEEISVIIRNRLMEIEFIKKYEFYLIEEDLMDGFCFIFFSKTKNKKIRIKFYPYYADNSVFEGFSISIKKYPFQLASDTLIVEDYLIYKKIEMNNEKFILLNYKGSFIERLNLFVGYFENTFNTYLIDIIEGQKWETIPVNWGHYK